MKQLNALLFILASLVLLGACSSNGTTATQAGTAFSCSVTAAVVPNTNEVSLTVSASGGTPNYNLTSFMAAGVTGNLISGSSAFSGSTTAVVQFSSLASASLLNTSGSVSLTDSSSPQSSTTCAFTVGTGTTVSGGLACTITPATISPIINQADSFTFTASGGSGSYTFSNFSPGTYGTISTGIVAVSTLQGTASAIYSTATSATASVYVTDTSGNSGTCSTVVTVGGSTTGGSSTLACIAGLSPTPSVRGQWVSATAQITASTAGNPYLQSLTYPTLSPTPISVSFTGALTAQIYFPIPGTFPITFNISDASQTVSSCIGYQQVN